MQAMVETHTESMITVDIVDTEEMVEAYMEEAVEAEIVEGIVEADIAVAIVVAIAEADTVVTTEVATEVAAEISLASVNKCFAFRSYVRLIIRILPSASRKGSARISEMANSTNWKKYVITSTVPPALRIGVYDPSSCFRGLLDVLLIYAFYT